MSIALPMVLAGSQSVRWRSYSQASSSQLFRSSRCCRQGTKAYSRSCCSLLTTRDGSPHEAAYFWLTGGQSAFLENAPIYLVFFEKAGGDAMTLMGPLAGTLAAISMGAVYTGALTYISIALN